MASIPEEKIAEFEQAKEPNAPMAAAPAGSARLRFESEEM
jgi:hypothetical protein